MTEEWQEQVVRMAAEALGVPNPEDATCNKMCERAWEAFDDAVYEALEKWVKNNRKMLERDVTEDDLWSEEGPYLVYMTIAGEGVGVWDGSWDHFFKRDRDIEKKLVPYLKESLSKNYSVLEHAIVDSAYETAEEAEGDRPPGEEELYDSIVITDRRGGGYDVVHAGRTIEQVVEWDDAVSEANIWMDKNRYWPNLYYINERGNVDLLDKDGKIIKSWV